MRFAVLRPLAALGLILPIQLAGCSDGPELGAVAGKVVQRGQPVPFAYVVFQPIDPPGTYGSAYTDQDGNYELQFTQSDNGALIGKHQVTIRTSAKDEIHVEDKATGLMVVPPLPEGYQERAEVVFEREVKPGNNVHDFDLAEAPPALSGRDSSATVR